MIKCCVVLTTVEFRRLQTVTVITSRWHCKNTYFNTLTADTCWGENVLTVSLFAGTVFLSLMGLHMLASVKVTVL